MVQRGGDWAGPQPAQAPPRCTKPNVTAHPSTASVPITVLLCNGPLLCGFNVGIKGLTQAEDSLDISVTHTGDCMQKCSQMFTHFYMEYFALCSREERCVVAYQMKSVQWLQNVGCLKKRATNACSLTR